MEDVQLKSFLLMLNEETKKSMDWLKDMFDTVDEKNFPEVDIKRLIDAMVNMINRKMEDYPDIWNDLLWVIAIHKRLLGVVKRAEAEGDDGDETAMLTMIVGIGWLEAFRRRFMELEREELHEG